MRCYGNTYISVICALAPCTPHIPCLRIPPVALLIVSAVPVQTTTAVVASHASSRRSLPKAVPFLRTCQPLRRVIRLHAPTPSVPAPFHAHHTSWQALLRHAYTPSHCPLPSVLPGHPSLPHAPLCLHTHPWLF